MTQKDIADRMGTTQSAISRIASLKTNPSYKQLLKMAGVERISTNEYLDRVIRDAIELERANYLNRTLVLNKVCEPRIKYRRGPKKTKKT